MERQCLECDRLGFMGLHVGGWRSGVLKKMVEEYKYQSVWAISEVLAEIVDVTLPLADGDGFWYGAVPDDVVIVPLPTIGRHVRERGLDHTLKLARKLAERREWSCKQILLRAADTVQVGAKADEREDQARRAYEVRVDLSTEKVYVLLDDVWTTGASMRAAAEVMKRAGATRLVGVVVAVGRPRSGDGMGSGEFG